MTLPKPVAKFMVFETGFESAMTYSNPFWDVTVTATLTAPSGQTRQVEAFWDGDQTWRLRFSPTEVGEWRWETQCSNAADTGLHGQTGRVRCEPYAGYNPLYQRGPLEVAPGGTHLQHQDGTPFFWLGDTAWNGAMRSRWHDWVHYLHGRRHKFFTVIQFVTTQWRGMSVDIEGEQAFAGTEQITINPAFFQRLDRKVNAINESYLIAAPVMLWTLTDTDPGSILAEADAIRLARYMVARWGAYQVVWLLGGDGRYLREPALVERWQRIGRAVFDEPRDRLATLHPCGQSWIGDEFRNETWFDFIGYQSGHGDAEEHLRWLVQGPPAQQWADEPLVPVINLEPNYEIHPAYHSQSVFGAYEIRRASYWSLLVSPTAGVTFGHNSIWVWPEEAEVPEGHERIGPVPSWYVGNDTVGVQSMTVLYEFFEQVDWTGLRPAPQLLREQPGEADPTQFVAAAQSEDGRLAVIYLPVGGTISLTLTAFEGQAQWVDPRTGEAQPIDLNSDFTFTAPDTQDWLLWLQAASSPVH